MINLFNKILLLVVISLLTACGGGGGGFTGSGEDKNATEVSELSLPSQVDANGGLAVFNKDEALPLQIIVKDTVGKPMPGTTLAYTTTMGSLSATLADSKAPTAAVKLKKILSNKVGLASGVKSLTVATDQSGLATAYLTGDGNEGIADITVTTGKISKSFKVNFSHAGGIVIETANKEIKADGKDQTRIWATVKDANNKIPLAGVKVSFSNLAGTLSPLPPDTDLSNIKTDIDGIAEVLLTSTNNVGNTTVTASASGFSAGVEVNFVAGATNVGLKINAAPKVINPKGSTTIKAIVTDINNYPVKAQTISFDVVINRTEGSLSTTSVATDNNGEATVTYTSGSSEGADTIRARLANGKENNVTIITNARSTVIGTISLVAGATNVTADGKSEVAIRAIVKDNNGNLAIGTVVNFETTAGKLSSDSAITDEKGLAEVKLIAPSLLGIALVTANASGFIASTTINCTAGKSIKVLLDAAPDIVNPLGESDLQATVLDSNDNPVNGQSVIFDIKTNNTGASLSVTTAITDTNGRASVVYTAGNLSGVDSIRVRSSNGSEALKDITVNSSALVVGAIKLTAGANSAVANGSSTVTIQANVTDTKSNPMSGITVNFTTTAGVLSTTSAITDKNGLAQVTLTSPTGMGTVSISGNASGFVGTVTINFTAGAPTQIILNAAPLTVNPKGASIIEALAQDANGNPVIGQTVVFTITNSPQKGVLSATSIITDVNGRATVTYTAGSEEGTDTIQARLNTGVKNTVAIKVNAAVKVIGSIALATGATSLVADGTSKVAVRATVKDADGNLASGATVAFATNSGTLDKQTATTNINGIAEVMLTAPKLAGSATITASVSGFIATATVTFTAGNSSQISLLASPETINPNGTSKIQATLLDTNGNPVANQTLLFEITTTPAKGTLSTNSVTTDANGQATVTYTAGKSEEGTDTIQARLNTGVKNTVAIKVNAAAKVIGSIALATGATSLVADGTSKVAVRATVKYADGNLASGATVAFATNSGTLDKQTATTNINGIAEVMLTAPKLAGSATITATVSGFIATATITFTAGNSSQINLLASPVNINPSGTSKIQATLLDTNGNPVANQTLLFDITTTPAKGTLSTNSVTTDANGQATVTYTAGKVEGSDTIRVRIVNGAEKTLDIKIVSNLISAKKLSLSTNKTIVKSDNSDSAVISAIAVDDKNVVVSGLIVTFTTTAGQLSIGSATTDANGKADVNFSSGTTDPSNTTATITAAISGSDLTASIPILVGGSTISLDTPSSSLEIGGSTATLTATVKNASGIPVFGTTIEFSVDGTGSATFDQATGTSDVNGQVKTVITPTSVGSITVTAKGLNATSTREFNISNPGGAFQITSPTQDPTSHITGQSLPISVNSASAVNVTFVTSLGYWLENGSNLLTIPSITGTATANLISNQSGTATVRAFDADNPAKFDVITVLFSASVSQAHHIDIQSNLTTMLPSIGGALRTAELTATVYTSANEPVANAAVVFSMSNTTSSGETLSPVYGITDNSGKIKSIFTSGLLSSGQSGILITATVYDTSSNAIASDSISINVNQTAGSVVIGKSTTITDANNATSYTMAVTAMVTDSAGSAVANSTISLTAWATNYSKGYWVSPLGDGKDCVPVVTADFVNEDINENLILDPGEDLNSDSMITPPNSSAGAIPATVTTDANGVANFNITYLKKYGEWITTRIRATTFVLGTETRGELIERLNVSNTDAKACLVFDSPFGK